jgi:hypothetical protein
MYIIVSVQRSLACGVALRVQRSSVGSALAWCMAGLSWNLGSAPQGGFFFPSEQHAMKKWREASANV